MDGSRGNARIFLTAPQGWEKRGVADYAVGFGLAGHTTGYPVIGVTASHIRRSSSASVTPANSYTGANLETAITELKNIEVFDAGVNGKLRIWRMRTRSHDYLLILIVRQHTEIDIYLVGDDADQLTPYLNSLKEVARSLRIVSR